MDERTIYIGGIEETGYVFMMIPKQFDYLEVYNDYYLDDTFETPTHVAAPFGHIGDTGEFEHVLHCAESDFPVQPIECIDDLTTLIFQSRAPKKNIKMTIRRKEVRS